MPSGAHARTFFTAIFAAVVVASCQGAKHPPVFVVATSDASTDASADVSADTSYAASSDGSSDASPAHDGGGPAMAGRPLSRLADLPVGQAELIEVALGEGGLTVACGARGGPVVFDAHDPAAPIAYPATKTLFAGRDYFRCSHVAVAGSMAYVSFRADSTMPSYLAAVELSNMPAVVAAYPAPAGKVFESVLALGDLAVVAMHRDGIGVFARDGGSFTPRATLGGLVNAQGLALVGDVLYVADGEGGLALVDVSDPAAPRAVGRLATGGIAQTVAVDPVSHTAYVSAGSAGIVIADVTHPAAPMLMGRVPTQGAVNQIVVADGRLYVAAWSDVRVYALDDPGQPSLVGVARPSHGDQLARVMGVAARGDVVAVADWDHFETWRFHAGFAAPYIEASAEPVLLGRVAADTSASAVIVVENLGRSPLAHATVSASDPAFSVADTEFALAPGESREVRVQYHAANEEQRGATLTFHANDADADDVSVALSVNASNVTVGDPAPPEVVRLADGTEWRLADQRGHVVLLAYFTTWCPVCGLEMPDLEANVWARYRARGLVMLGVDPPLSSVRAPDTADDVAAFARHAAVTFPLGVSTTTVYDTLRTASRDLTAPFPLIAVIDPMGKLTYIGTTIDDARLTAALDEALAVSP